MYEYGVSCRIDELGRVLVPRALREQLRFTLDTELEMLPTLDGDGITIRRRRVHCALCGCVQDLVAFRGDHLCRSCINGIKNTQV